MSMSPSAVRWKKIYILQKYPMFFLMLFWFCSRPCYKFTQILTSLSWHCWDTAGKRPYGQVSNWHVACCRGHGVSGRKDVFCRCCPHHCSLCWFWPIAAIPSGVYSWGSLWCATSQIQTIGLWGLNSCQRRIYEHEHSILQTAGLCPIWDF